MALLQARGLRALSLAGGGYRGTRRDHLPCEVRVYLLLNEQCTCGCGGALHVVDTEVTGQFGQIPSKLDVIEFHRRRRSCRGRCDDIMQRASAQAALSGALRVITNMHAGIFASKYVELSHCPAWRPPASVATSISTASRWRAGCEDGRAHRPGEGSPARVCAHAVRDPCR